MSALYVVGTPIGNLKDITLRALEVLKFVDVIACEDTRTSMKLLQHYQISKPLISCHKYNETERSEEIIDMEKMSLLFQMLACLAFVILELLS